MINFTKLFEEFKKAGFVDVPMAVSTNGKVNFGLDVDDDTKNKINTIIENHSWTEEDQEKENTKNNILKELAELDTVLSREGEEFLQALIDANIPLNAVWSKRVEAKTQKELLRAQLLSL